MTTTATGPDISPSEELDLPLQPTAIPVQCDDFASSQQASVSPSRKDALARYRSLDEQTATDIAAGW